MCRVPAVHCGFRLCPWRHPRHLRRCQFFVARNSALSFHSPDAGDVTSIGSSFVSCPPSVLPPALIRGSFIHFSWRAWPHDHDCAFLRQCHATHRRQWDGFGRLPGPWDCSGHFLTLLHHHTWHTQPLSQSLTNASRLLASTAGAHTFGCR